MHGGDSPVGPQRVDAYVVEDPKGLHHIMIETALKPLVAGTYSGKGKHITDLMHDAGSCKRALLVMLLNELGKFFGVTNLE
jgi:hypothetical protein